jgi:phosphoglycerate dehydrogenase-like enzyme
MTRILRVGITSGFLHAGKENLLAREALDLLDRHGIVHEYFETTTGELPAALIAGYDAVVLLGERIGPRSLAEQSRLLAIARWGVGYDAIDLDACTAHDVCVFITPEGVRRPVAIATLTLLLALTLKLRQKDALVRGGDWGQKADYLGEMLTGKVLGTLGLGRIGRELFRLAAPLGMRHIAHDPYLDPAQTEVDGVRIVDKAALLRETDVLCITCALTPETFHAIGSVELALMKPSAYLINTARGPIVDEEALVAALRHGRLRGAGLDVFEQEPLPLDSPLLSLDNVWLAPHALAWTEELTLGVAMEDAEGLVRLARGELPRTIVNHEVVERAGFQARLRELRQSRQP